MSNKPGYVGCRLSDLAYILPKMPEDSPYQSLEMDADGTLTYTPKIDGAPFPPYINGYVRDPNNPYRFLPLWLDCTTRTLGLSKGKPPGSINIHMGCNNPGCTTHKKYVNHQQCAQCPLRESFKEKQDADFKEFMAKLEEYSIASARAYLIEPDGTIVYAQDDRWEPPRDIEGYKRDPNDAWRFKPQWLPCAWRKYIGKTLPNCGCLGLEVECYAKGTDTYGKQVSYIICKDCQHRQESPHGM